MLTKTKQEIRKKIGQKCGLKARKLLSRARKFTIDANLNMKVAK